MNMFLLCHYLQFLMHVTQAHVKTMPHAHLPMAFTPAAVQAVSQEHNANQVGDTICNENTSSLHVIDHKNNAFPLQISNISIFIRTLTSASNEYVSLVIRWKYLTLPLSTQFSMHVSPVHVVTTELAHPTTESIPAAVQAVSQEHNANQV